MEEKIFAFWLCNLPGIGHRKIEHLLAYFGCPREIFFGSEQHFARIQGLLEKDRELLSKNRTEDSLKKSYEEFCKRGNSFVYREEESYPEKLRQLSDMPYGIYYKGKLPEQNIPSIAVVGAREASYGGRQIADKLSFELAENGIQVISGLARGIDIAAHRGALKSARGKTFAVLGTGVDICYPGQHIETYMIMQENGGVLSEFPMQAPALPYHFPMRNRIISGLSDGILVIEAGKKSGSLITAEAGLEQGKEIFVVPGSIADSRYEGGNELLKSGAVLVTGIKDILDGLGLFYDCDVVERKKKINDMLETTEKMVYAMLSLEPVHISEIIEKTGLSPVSVMEILLSMQIRHLVQAIGNNYFAIKL